MRYSVCIPGQVDAISPVVDEIMSHLRGMPCAKNKEFAIETALREALANAILHGCKGDPAKYAECLLECRPDGSVMIVVRDPGEGFDPDSLPSPVNAENLGADHGRGVYLIRQLMDEVHYTDGGREVRMKKT